MSRADPQMKLRLLPELKQRIEAAAKDAGRSMNAEILARLETSFDGGVNALPFTVSEAIQHEQDQRGGTREQALVRLVLAGLSQGGTVVNIQIAPGTTMAQVKAMIDAAYTLLPADSSMFMERV